VIHAVQLFRVPHQAKFWSGTHLSASAVPPPLTVGANNLPRVSGFVMVCSLLEVACSDSQSVVQEAALRALRTMSTAQPLLRQVSARWAGKTGLLGELITSQQLVMSRRDVSKFPHFVQKSL